MSMGGWLFAGTWGIYQRQHQCMCERFWMKKNHCTGWGEIILNSDSAWYQLVNCFYLQCKYLHSCLIVWKLLWEGGRPILVIVTDIVSAFDISLSQVSGGRMGVLVSWLRIDLRAVCFSRMCNNKTNAKCWAQCSHSLVRAQQTWCVPEETFQNSLSFLLVSIFPFHETTHLFVTSFTRTCQSMTVEDSISFIPSMYCLYLQHFKLSVNICWVNKWLILAYKAWVRIRPNSYPLFQLDQEMFIILLNYFLEIFVLRERIKAFILNRWFQFLT